MKKWTQHAEKSLGHFDYIEIITQICRSNNFSLDFEKRSLNNMTNFFYFIEHLDYMVIKNLNGMKSLDERSTTGAMHNCSDR
jgi:hypothetical protein